MQIRSMTKADYHYIVSVIDRWWGGPAGQGTHPIFFYELGDHALVVESDDEIIGFLFGFITATESPTGYVHLVGIHPDRRRHGVGRALYEHFTAACKVGGAQRLKAITTKGNQGSIRFHEAQGFEVHTDPDYAGRDRMRVIFTKDLTD